MDMSDNDAKSGMRLLFVLYHKLLSLNGLKLVLESNQKLFMLHALSAIRQLTLQERPLSVIQFTYSSICKDFKEFMKHVIDLSDALQKLNVGPKLRVTSKSVTLNGSHADSLNSEKGDGPNRTDKNRITRCRNAWAIRTPRAKQKEASLHR